MTSQPPPSPSRRPRRSDDEIIQELENRLQAARARKMTKQDPLAKRLLNARNSVRRLLQEVEATEGEDANTYDKLLSALDKLEEALHDRGI